MTEYGIRARDWQRVLVMSAFIAVSVLVAGFIALRGRGLDAHTILPLIGLSIAVAGFLPLMMLAVSLVHLRVRDGVVQQVFMRRRVLMERPLTSLIRISQGGLAAAVLHFRDGSRMRLYGAAPDEVQRLYRELTPEQALKFPRHGLATAVRRVYRVLPSGLGIVAVLLWAFRRRIGPLPHPAPQWVGAALAVAAVAVLSVAFLGFRVKIPGRAPHQSPDDFWADGTARGAALILWTLAAGAGIMAGVGYFITGSTWAATALVLAIFALLTAAPGRLDR